MKKNQTKPVPALSQCAKPHRDGPHRHAAHVAHGYLTHCFNDIFP